MKERIEVNYRNPKWTIQYEIDFLQRIGTWKPDQMTSTRELLMGYLEGLRLRSDMQGMHRRRLQKIAESLLRKVEGS